jgi:short-subunit dehydrogenase
MQSELNGARGGRHRGEPWPGPRYRRRARGSGAAVALVARGEAGLRETGRIITDAGAVRPANPIDVQAPEQVAGLQAEVADAFGPPSSS